MKILSKGKSCSLQTRGLCLMICGSFFLNVSLTEVSASVGKGGIQLIPDSFKGGVRGLNPGSSFDFLVIQGDCAKFSPPTPQNQLSKNVIRNIVSKGENKYQLIMGEGRGLGLIVVQCENNPDLTAGMLVLGNGGAGPFTADEIISWFEYSQPLVSFTESQNRDWVNTMKSNVDPGISDNPEISRTENDQEDQRVKTNETFNPFPDVTGDIILLGAGLTAGAIILGIGLSGAFSSSSITCEQGYSPCGNYEVCCRDQYKYCPGNGKCYQTLFDARECPGGTVNCQ